MKCCARCKSPYGCANGACPCHGLFRAARERTAGTPLLVISPLSDAAVVAAVLEANDER